MSGTTTPTTLVVVIPFNSYTRGQVITDGAAIAAILAGPYYGYVVSTTAAITGAPSPGVVTVASGIDHSWNAPALPSSTILVNIGINPIRETVEILNATDTQLLLVFDDGNGGALSVYPLDPSAANAQGGAWTSEFFKGRIRIYATNGNAPNGFIYAHEI